jgi:two-component system, sensor histidine kinase and response regulator
MLYSEILTKNPKILAVDDRPDNLCLLEAIFSETDDYELSCVEGGRAAIDAVEASPPDLILLDVMMPDMNGYEVTHRIRQNRGLPYIPILLLTAHDEVSATVGLDAGADGVIRKPFDIQELLDRVESLLQHKYACC